MPLWIGRSGAVCVACVPLASWPPIGSDSQLSKQKLGKFGKLSEIQLLSKTDELPTEKPLAKAAFE